MWGGQTRCSPWASRTSCPKCASGEALIHTCLWSRPHKACRDGWVDRERPRVRVYLLKVQELVWWSTTQSSTALLSQTGLYQDLWRTERTVNIGELNRLGCHAELTACADLLHVHLPSSSHWSRSGMLYWSGSLLFTANCNQFSLLQARS